MKIILTWVVFAEAAIILHLFYKYQEISKKLDIVDKISSMIDRIFDTQDHLRSQHSELKNDIKNINKIICDKNFSTKINED